MLTMTTCRRWILLLVTGSAIGAILAAPNTTESAVNNGWPYPPGDKEEVAGVEPLHVAVSPKEEIPTTTIEGDVVSKRPLISLGENKKLSATSKAKYDGKHAKFDLSPTEIIKDESSIEEIPPKSNEASSSLEMGAEVIPRNKTGPVETGARSLRGNDVAVVGDEQTDARNSLHGNITDLSDVSMDYDYKDIEGGEYLASSNVSGTNMGSPASGTRCTYGNETYLPGTMVTRNCEDQCVCGSDGILANCEPICVIPFVRSGRGVKDSLCREKLIPDKPCCAILICAQDSEPEPEESCYLGNKTVARGDTVEDGCSKVCVCEAQGKLKCRPRCPPSNSTSTVMAASTANQRDKCVPLPDPRDPCCTITLCDVTLGDFDQFKPDLMPSEIQVNLTKVVALNSTAIKLAFSNNVIPEHTTIEVSTDHRLWREQKLNKDGIIGNLEPSHTYHVRVGEGADHRPGASMQVVLPAEPDSVPTAEVTMVNNGNINASSSEVDGEVCHHRGKSYKVGAEWYDECISFCTCSMVGNAPKTECATIECPTDFGLDVLDPNCLDWEWVPADFVPKPPQCCSQEVRCRNNGSCLYEGKSYINWSEIPSNVTGCEKRCYCELGNVSCHSACPPVTALPPANLQCPPSHASLKHLPEDECCLHWVCGDPSTASLPNVFGPDRGLPPGFPIRGGPPGIQSSSDQITVKTLEAIDENRVRLVFMVPPILVGLHGRVEVRYTSEVSNVDPATWKSQIFAPPDDLIATPQLEFELGDLASSTEYKVMVAVKLRDISNSPTSKIYKVTTLEAPISDVVTLPPQIPTDPELTVAEANSTWANLVWKKFTEYELQFIDGVQLRYKETEGKVYAATPLIHRAVTSYVIENLKPAVTYEVGIHFIPFPGQTTELVSKNSINFTTSAEPDPYSFDIKVEIKGIKSTEVEVAWRGVPYPEDKYVNIYRAIYQSDTGKEDTSTFKIAKRDSPARTMIGELKPGTRYRLWIEVYLTNGRIKKSNVQDFVTKPGVPSSAGVLQQGKLASQVPVHEGDYYGPLVIVAIVASLAILSTLILLMMLMKRRSSSKADISPRKTTAAYDNPSYKVEIQQETMDL